MCILRFGAVVCGLEHAGGVPQCRGNGEGDWVGGVDGQYLEGAGWKSKRLDGRVGMQGRMGDSGGAWRFCDAGGGYLHAEGLWVWGQEWTGDRAVVQSKRASPDAECWHARKGP